MQGFFKQEMTNIKQILFCTDPQVSVGIIVDDSGVEAGDDGRKIVPAGTPMYGSLLDRATPFTVTQNITPEVATVNEALTTVTVSYVTVSSAYTFRQAVQNISGTYKLRYEGSEDQWWLTDAEDTYISAGSL